MITMGCDRRYYSLSSRQGTGVIFDCTTIANRTYTSMFPETDTAFQTMQTENRLIGMPTELRGRQFNGKTTVQFCHF